MRKPIATFFAGVNGCGKTTLYYNELEKGNSFGYRINIDEIVSSFGDWRSQEDQVRGSKIAIKIRNKMISNKEDFNQETTLCGKSILSLIKDLVNRNYEINLYYISVDSPKIAKERVKLRVSKGGHDIDSSIIERRFISSLENLNKIYSLCDKITIFDNTKGFNKVLETQNAADFSLELRDFVRKKMQLNKIEM